ncbi:peroxidasin homolog [Dreissena polymorpha]|nr:peroxidasin homolog [Dreissena polymorpha]
MIISHDIFVGNERLIMTPNKANKDKRLDSNPLICDCELRWLAETVQGGQSEVQATATCSQPAHVQGRDLADVPLADFNCITQPASTQNVAAGSRDINLGRGTLDNRVPQEVPRITTDDNRDRDSPANRVSSNQQQPEVANRPDSQTRRHEERQRQVAPHVAPTFLTRPSDIHAAQGDNVDLPCSASGFPQPEITWTLNGRQVRVTSRVSLVGGGLHIVSVSDEDRGEYRCRAENSLGVVTATAGLHVQVPPSFVLRPVDVVTGEDGTAVFQCDAMGEPTPLISWYKNNDPIPNNGRFTILDSGRTLRISRVEAADRDVYVCRAESAAGRMEAQAELQVSSQTAPTFNQRRVDEIEVEEGTDVQVDCAADGQPAPIFRWIKDGVTLRNGRKYHSEGIQLTIRRAIQSDEGLYECFAENTLGFARHAVRLRVTTAVVRPGDQFVNNAIQTATERVNAAINITRSELFQRGRTHNVQDLMTLFRYPSAESLELARAEEIFEETLELIYKHVAEGHQYNLTGHELSYQEIVSPAHLALIANMSGCFRRTFPQRCTNMCFHKKYRTLDGTCNNLQSPSWGSSNSALQRLLPPEYENGFNSPKGWTRGRLYHGVHLPSPRLVSSVILSTELTTTDDHDTHMVMQWGQFVDHDIGLTPQSVSQHVFNDGRRCNETCTNSYPCFPIPVPASDQRVQGQSCLGFHRSSATCNTGTTSIFFKTFSHRQQLNALTSYIDGSTVYGSDDNMAERLRDLNHEHGHLLVGSLSQQGKRLLPYDFHGILGATDCQIESSKRYIPCFLAGDSRVNEQLALTVMHTLWMREHNRIADELREINPHWDGNMLYHEARKIIGGMMQHITYTAWLPRIIGPEGMKMLGEYQGYNPTVDSSVTNEFTTAAMRFGHSLIQPILFRLNSSFQQVPEGNLPLHHAFFTPWRVVEEGGVDPVLRGLFAQGAKKKMPSEIMNSELTERLFALANKIGQDLASLNIQRGRDHGLPSYTEYRKLFNLTVATRFEELRNEIQDRETRANLELIYGNVENIDLFVGGMAETTLPGAKVGPTFRHILVDQFRRLRDGDRFWYENTMVFSPDQLVQLKQFSLARVICDSGDDVTHVQRDVFTMVKSRDEYLPCRNIPQIDLKMWSDCCMDCGKAGDFRSITNHFRRRRDSTRFSYQSDKPESEHKTVTSLGDFRSSVYSKHEVDTQMQEMKLRMREMETLVDDMEHAMKKMKKNMATMMSHAAKEMFCMEDSGEKRMHGDKWSRDDCTVCRCKMGKTRCKTVPCPTPNCPFPKKMPGQCCMVC